MTPEQLRVTRIQSFIQLAKEELQVSAAIRMAHRRQSAYFLQRAVEKALRGILEVEGCVAGPMHSIRGLSDLLPAGHAFRVRFLDLEPLLPPRPSTAIQRRKTLWPISTRSRSRPCAC